MQETLEAYIAKLKVESHLRFKNFITELEDESDRGAAIFAGTFFESKLKQILHELLEKGKSTTTLLEDANGGLNTFSSKINICLSLGFITENEFNALNHLKKIRNQFAHNFDFKFSFENKSISGLCLSLKKEFPELQQNEKKKSREVFISVISLLHSRLIDRHYEIITISSPTIKIGDYLQNGQFSQFKVLAKKT